MIYSVYWMNVLVPRILEKERVRLFHAANVAVPVLAPCPCVATIHDLVSFRVPGTHGRLYEFYRRQSIPDAARRAARIVAVSESTKRDIEELVGVCPDKIRVIHHGVDDGLAPVADRATLDRARRRFRLPSRFVLHVGAVERQKRLEPLMGAAAAVLRHGLVEGVVLAGEEGPGAADVRREVARLGIAERVHFLGYVTREDLPALYTLARCTVYPSWYEGFGMPVLEAMACGSPVVTSNTSSLPEVAGGAGLLVPPGDSRAIASALERILSDDRFRTELVAKGLVRARQFKWETCAAKHIGVYREVLETPG
jgi:glycosyltransferase involved in cell wall biosynthesis